MASEERKARRKLGDLGDLRQAILAKEVLERPAKLRADRRSRRRKRRDRWKANG